MSDDESQSAPSNRAQEQPEHDESSLADRLAEAEIEALRKDQNEALDALQKVFPNLRVHRAGQNSPEELKQ